MRSIRTKRKAPGGWRATQGGIPVSGIKVVYRVGRWVQRLFSRTVWAMEQRLSALDIEIERRTQK
jgi:hypothetical protein